MGKRKRVSKLEKERRILTVQGWIIDGAQDNFILRQVKSKWDLSLRQAKRYLRNAYENWKVDEKISIEDKRAAKVAELKQDIRSLKAEFQGTPQGMNAKARLHKLVIKLEDLEPASRHEIESNVNSVVKPVKFIDATGND